MGKVCRWPDREREDIRAFAPPDHSAFADVRIVQGTHGEARVECALGAADERSTLTALAPAEQDFSINSFRY